VSLLMTMACALQRARSARLGQLGERQPHVAVLVRYLEPSPASLAHLGRGQGAVAVRVPLGEVLLGVLRGADPELLDREEAVLVAVRRAEARLLLLRQFGDGELAVAVRVEALDQRGRGSGPMVAALVVRALALLGARPVCRLTGERCTLQAAARGQTEHQELEVVFEAHPSYVPSQFKPRGVPKGQIKLVRQERQGPPRAPGGRRLLVVQRLVALGGATDLSGGAVSAASKALLRSCRASGKSWFG
jgi:hypothetical protein